MTEGKRRVMANVERLNNLMDRNGLSAVVLRSGKNFTYLAGFAYPGTLARHLDLPDSPRGVVLVWPLHGEPTMVLNSWAAPLARRDSWLQNIELYDDYGGSPYTKAAEVITGMGLGGSRIGFEKSYVSADGWDEVYRALPKSDIVDCTTMMAEVRWVKTPGEVELLKIAANMLDEAYLEVFPTIREGDTEREVHSRILRCCIQGGANWAHGILNSSRNTVGYGGESDMEFRKGDIIRNDYVSYHLGYPGHQSRCVVVGSPSNEQRRIYKAVLDIYKGTIDRCRPGVRADAVYESAAEAFRRAGFRERMALAGHGVGRGGTSRNRTLSRGAKPF